MTEQALLEETVAYYHKNPSYRCKIEQGACKYRGGSVEHKSYGCAIGRQLSKKNRNKLDEMFPDGKSINNLLLGEGAELLPKWMRNMNSSFLSELQSLHDSNNNWNEDGLNDAGKENIEVWFGNYNLDLAFLDKY